MRREPWSYALFFTSAAAFRAERLCRQEASPSARLVPTPRSLSSDCGSALRFSPADAEAVAAVLARNSVPFDRIEVLTSSAS